MPYFILISLSLIQDSVKVCTFLLLMKIYCKLYEVLLEIVIISRHLCTLQENLGGNNECD